MTSKKHIFLIISLITLSPTNAGTTEPQQNSPSEPTRIDRIKKQAKEFLQRFMGYEQYRSEQIQRTRAAVLIPAAILIGGGGLLYWKIHGKRKGPIPPPPPRGGLPPPIPPPPPPLVHHPVVGADGGGAPVVPAPAPGGPAPALPAPDGALVGGPAPAAAAPIVVAVHPVARNRTLAAAIRSQEFDKRLVGILHVVLRYFFLYYYLTLLSRFG